jgi:CheY-like chemotaxis protein
VLLVDDEPDARELLTEVLQQCGAVVVAAHSADEAVRLIPRERPRCCCPTSGCPGEDGYKLISRVRALPPEAAATSRRRRSPPTRAPTTRAGRWRPATSATRRNRSSRRRWPRWSRAWRT